MGIELPTPNGEHAVQPSRNGEMVGFVATPESSRTDHIVETGTTEKLSPQEVRVTGGGGSGHAATIQSVVTDTTYSGQPAQSAAPSLDDVPVVAADEDLIEKQWVESVKKIVRETRNDPYKQGEAISRLQADYLQKRYGKTVGQAGA